MNGLHLIAWAVGLYLLLGGCFLLIMWRTLDVPYPQFIREIAQQESPWGMTRYRLLLYTAPALLVLTWAWFVVRELGNRYRAGELRWGSSTTLRSILSTVLLYAAFLLIFYDWSQTRQQLQQVQQQNTQLRQERVNRRKNVNVLIRDNAILVRLLQQQLTHPKPPRQP